MLNFLNLLRSRGFTVSISEIDRIHLILSTGDNWTMFRLQETLRSILVHEIEKDDLFDECFTSYFSDYVKEDEYVDIPIFLSKLENLNFSQELLKHESPPDKTPLSFILNKRRIIISLVVILCLAFTLFIYQKNQSDQRAPIIDVKNSATNLPKNGEPLKDNPPDIKDNPPDIKDNPPDIKDNPPDIKDNPPDIKDNPPDIKDNPRFWTDKQWWIIGLSLGLLVITILIKIKFRISRYFPLAVSKRRKITDYKGPQEFFLIEKLPNILDSEILDFFADSLRYYESRFIDTKLDVSRTVESTCRRMIPDIIYQKLHILKEIIILVDTGINMQPVYDIAGEITDGLIQRGVPVKRGFFHHRPDLFSIPFEGNYWLQDIESQLKSCLMMIFSDGYGINEEEDRLIFEDLSNFPNAVWMDTRPDFLWDARTLWVSNFIKVFPATPGGIKEASVFFGTEQGGIKHIVDIAPPYINLEFYLQDYLQWACGCALIRPMDIGVAELMRKKFFPELPAEGIYLLINLPRTRRIQNAFSFSEPVTRQLLSILRERWPDTEACYRQWLDRMLNIHEPQRQSAAHLTWQYQKAMNLLNIDPKSALIASKILKKLIKTPLKEFVIEEMKPYSDNAEYGIHIPLRSMELKKSTVKSLGKAGLDITISPPTLSEEELDISDSLKKHVSVLMSLSCISFLLWSIMHVIWTWDIPLNLYTHFYISLLSVACCFGVFFIGLASGIRHLMIFLIPPVIGLIFSCRVAGLYGFSAIVLRFNLINISRNAFYDEILILISLWKMFQLTIKWIKNLKNRKINQIHPAKVWNAVKLSILLLPLAFLMMNILTYLKILN